MEGRDCHPFKKNAYSIFTAYVVPKFNTKVSSKTIISSVSV